MEHEGLIARIRQMRRITAANERRSAPESAAEVARIDALEERVRHLERLIEGLQDSVHRESERHAKMIAELQEQVQPGTMGAALSKNARDRGLA